MVDVSSPFWDNAQVSPSVRVVMAGALLATGGALIKSCDFPSLERAGLRSLIAAVTIFALLPETRRRPTRTALLLLPAYFGATCLFVVANTLTTAANTIFLQSTSPLWIALLSPWLLHEPATRRELLSLVGIGCGVTLLFLVPDARIETAPRPQLGNLVALASGLSYGLLLLGLRWLTRRSPSEAFLTAAWGNALSAPIAFALMPLFGQRMTGGDPGDWLVISYLGVVQVGVAYVVLVRAIAHVSAVRASLLLMIEPALNPAIAFVIHGERPHLLGAAGGVLIVASVALNTMLAARAAGRPAR